MPAADEDEKLLQRHVADMVSAVRHRGGVRYSAFLNDRQRQLAEAVLRREGYAQYLWNGGYEGAERTMLCVFEDNGAVDFPFEAVTICPNVVPNSLDHRDYLGALLATGVRRATIGDIVVADGCAVVFLQSSIVPFVQQQLESVGRLQAAVRPAKDPIQDVARVVQRTGTASVASLRLDAVLAQMLSCSRGQAAEMVRQGRVQVNHLATASLHCEVQAGDVLSVRGVGRYRLDAIGGQSRKKRIFIEFSQY